MPIDPSLVAPLVITPSEWAHRAWGAHPGSIGITVPADGLHWLLTRCAQLEALSGAVEERIQVHVTIDPKEEASG